MASGHVNRIKRPDTWLHRPMPQNVKKVLANPEPSTHGTKRTWRDVRHESAFGGKAENIYSERVFRLFTHMYGPAVRCKRFSSSWHSAVLHQCIRSLIGADLLRTIMDISARAISLADRPQRAIRVTSVRKRREDRSSISSHPLADLGR